MRLLYNRTASQEYETEIEFNIAPFSDAEWHIKHPSVVSNIFGTWLDSNECIEIGYDMKLITVDNKVIEELWGAPVSDLMDYITEVRDETNSPVIRQYETDVSIDGNREPMTIHLKVHYQNVTEGKGFDLEHKTKPIVYAEVGWSDEIYDDEWTIYDCSDYEVNMI